jgi:hypothetical protein
MNCVVCSVDHQPEHWVADPSGEELAGEMDRVHSGILAEQVKLLFPYNVDWIMDGKIVLPRQALILSIASHDSSTLVYLSYNLHSYKI